MNIAINGRYLSAKKVTGVERVADELSRLIPLLDKKNKYYIFADPESNSKKEYKKIKNLHWINFSFSEKSFILKHFQEQLLLPLALKKHKIDLLFNPTNTAPILAAHKSVLLLHCLHIFAFPQEYNAIFRRYYHWLLPKLFKRTKMIVTISNFSKIEIEKFLGKKTNITIIPNGVSPIFNQKILTKKQPYILYVGSLNPRKNPQALIESYNNSYLKEIYQLKIIGNNIGSFKKIPTAPNIQYINNVTDQELAKYYQQATVFVFPSLHEGFGLPPLEAMASGTPVIASDLPAIREVGDKAIYYIQPKAKEIQIALERLLANPKLQQKMILKGKKRAELFGWRNSAQKYIQLFNDLLA